MVVVSVWDYPDFYAPALDHVLVSMFGDIVVFVVVSVDARLEIDLQESNSTDGKEF